MAQLKLIKTTSPIMHPDGHIPEGAYGIGMYVGDAMANCVFFGYGDSNVDIQHLKIMADGLPQEWDELSPDEVALQLRKLITQTVYALHFRGIRFNFECDDFAVTGSGNPPD